MRNWSACITLILLTSGLAVYAGCGGDEVGSSPESDGGTDPAPDSGAPEDPGKDPGKPGEDGGTDGKDAGDGEPKPGAHIIGYVHASEPDEDESTPDASTSFNASGGDIKITRTDTGNYSVKFEGLDLSDSVALVSPYNLPGGNCAWVSTEDDIVKVRCTSFSEIADGQFHLAVVSKNGTTGATILGSAHAHDKVAEEYELDAATNNNAVGGGAIKATRITTGLYEMEFDGLGPNDIENVQVKAYGDESTRCVVVSLNGPTVKTHCHDRFGTAADSEYTVLLFGKKTGGTARAVAYAHAEQESGGAYNPALAFNSTDASVTANRSAEGTYTIAFAKQNFDSGAQAQIVSYNDGHHCVVTDLAGSGVKLTCVHPSSGTKVDSQYAIIVVQ